MRQLFTVIILFTCALMSAQETTGSVVGVISDKEMNNDPLPFANVQIKGTSTGTTTDMDGLYEISSVEPGTYTIVISFIGYETLEVPNISVEAGKVTELNTGLGAGSVSLDEVVVTTTARRESETALLLDQKKAIEIKQSIGADELKRKAINNVEQGLTKISGISNVQDRGIFVRGLDDRYNYLLINGLPLASSDPDNKIIPLNYISTNVVGAVDVYKTFNASLYQDFAGATFEINTKETPIEPVTVISVGVNYNTNTTLKDFYTDNSGDSEFFGFNGGGRKLPTPYQQNQEYGYTATPEESAELFNTSWTPNKTKAPLATTMRISHGQRLYGNDKSALGFFFSANYRNSFNTSTGVERALNSEGTAQQDFNTTNYNFTTQKSGLLSLNYKRYNKLSLVFNTIYFQNSSNFIREASGLNDNFTQLNNKDFYIRDTKYTENDVLSFQLLGDLQWEEKKHQLHFGGSVGIGNNNVPDRRVLRAAGSGEDAEYITTNGIDPFKFYQELENKNANARLEYELGLQPNDNTDFDTKIKVGYNFDAIEYDFFNRLISVDIDQSSQEALPPLNTNDPEAFFQQGFSDGYLFYANTADPAAKSRILQYINAGYIDFSKQWGEFLFQLGARAEYAYREIVYREPLSSIDDQYLKEEYNPFDISPSLNVKYTMNEKSNLRFAASKTITRPRLREILPTVYQDGDGNQVIGNPDLINSTNYNADLKYEFFPSSSEVIAIGAFGKYLENPIERLSRATSIGYRTFFDNFDEAYLFGLELETKLNIGNITKSEALEDLTFGFNGILMNSNASTSPDNPRFAAVTNKDRKLQGASDWGVNTDLAYQLINREKLNSTVNLIFNTYGKRIYAVGVEGADDIYEKPINQLDFSWNTDFNDTWGLRFTVRNILNEKTMFTQNPTQEIMFPDRFSNVTESFDRGVTFGLNVTYKF